MKVRFTQIVDFWIGVPLCFVVSLWAALVRLVARAGPPRPRRILFIELSEMGSAILAYSSLARARELAADGQVYFLIFAKNRDSVALLELLPPEHILTIRDDSFAGFVGSTLRALRQIRRLGIDTVLDLELFSRVTALISYLTGAATRVGFSNYTSEGLYRGRLLTHPVLYNHHQHMALNFLALVFALEAPAGETPLLKRDVRPALRPLPRCRIADADRETVWRRLHAERPALTPATPLVILNPDPGPVLPIRGWALANFADLARQVVERLPDATIVVMGLPDARPYAEVIARAAGAARCVDFTGKTASLREVVTLLALGRVLVTNDSGPAHVAALTDIRNLVLFGPETPKLYGPLGDNATALYAGLACSPCVGAANHRHTVCRDNKCLQAIPVQQVLDAVVQGCAGA